MLDRFGLTQVELADLLSVNPRTVNLWATGDSKVPGPVAAYLRVLGLLTTDRLAIELARIRKDSEMLEEGIYQISFEGDVGIGVGIVVLKDGTVSGTDVGGVRYDGIYSFDKEKQRNSVELKLTIPPSGQLVTGLKVGPTGAQLPVKALFQKPSPEASFVVEVAGRKVSGKVQLLRKLAH